MCLAATRTQDHQRYQQWWTTLRPNFDDALTAFYHEMTALGVNAMTFYERFKCIAALFAPASDLDQIFEAGDDVESVMELVQRIAGTSLFCKSLLADKTLRAGTILFERRITQRLRDISHVDFDDTEITAFERLCKTETDQLAKAGLIMIDTFVVDVKYNGLTMKTEMRDINDLWKLPLEACLRTAAKNSGKLDLTPWEALLLTPGSIPEPSLVAKISSSRLSEAQGSGAAIKNFLGAQPLTIQEMKDKLANCSKTKALKQLDSKIVLGLKFLNDCVVPLLVARIEKAILASLPTPEAPLTIQKACRIAHGNCNMLYSKRSAHPAGPNGISVATG